MTHNSIKSYSGIIQKPYIQFIIWFHFLNLKQNTPNWLKPQQLQADLYFSIHALFYIYILCNSRLSLSVINIWTKRDRADMWVDPQLWPFFPPRQPRPTAQEIYILMAQTAFCWSASEWKLSWNLGWLPPNDQLRRASSHINTGTKNRNLIMVIKPMAALHVTDLSFN